MSRSVLLMGVLVCGVGLGMGNACATVPSDVGGTQASVVPVHLAGADQAALIGQMCANNVDSCKALPTHEARVECLLGFIAMQNCIAQVQQPVAPGGALSGIGAVLRTR